MPGPDGSRSTATTAPALPVPAERRRPPAWQMAMFAWNALVFLAWGTLPFVAAGTARWWQGWAYLGAILAAAFAQGRYVKRRNPGLRARRRAIGAGTKRWDLVWNVCFWPLMAASPVAAGLDFHARGATLPAWLWPAGAALLACGFALSARAMAVNPFFEGTARIQRDAGQHVVEAGPYRFVRHPGYLGLVLWAAASPFLLVSARALAPAAVAVAWIALRTLLEDRMLGRELPGYPEYAARVRSRLLPPLW